MFTQPFNLNQELDGPTITIKGIKYGKLNEIGKGSYATCFRIKSRETLEYSAVKIVPLCECNEFFKFAIKQEALLHKKLMHHNIVEIYSCFIKNDTIYMHLELCDKNLKQYMSCIYRFTEDEIQHYAMQIIDGLEYLHKNCIIHRDIKLENILLKGVQIKIADFNTAIKLNSQDDIRTDVCGTNNYFAPEMIIEKQYSFPVDIWAFGVVIYFMATKEFPFRGSTRDELFDYISKIEWSFNPIMDCSRNLKDLIYSIFQKVPLRLSIGQIQFHSFFSMQK